MATFSKEVAEAAVAFKYNFRYSLCGAFQSFGNTGASAGVDKAKIPPHFSIKSSQEHSKAVLILLAVVMRMLISPASIQYENRSTIMTSSRPLVE